MAKFSVDQYTKKLQDINKVLSTGGKFVEIAARTSMAIESVRIFQKGEKTNGSIIGTYDNSNELWLSDKVLPKTGNHTGKTGKRIKTSYYKSYEAARQEQGRESRKVNLRWTNDLQSDYNNAPVSRSSNEVSTPNPKKLTPFRYAITLTRKKNRIKRRGLEDKYGTIFDLSKEGEEAFLKESRLQLLKIIG